MLAGSNVNSSWNDAPPTEVGFYWVRERNGGAECIAEYTKHPLIPSPYWYLTNGDESSNNEEMQRYYQFGPKVPSATEIVERGLNA